MPRCRHRLTYFDALAREILISAATCAMGRVLQRSINRRRPSKLDGALAWGTRRPFTTPTASATLLALENVAPADVGGVISVLRCDPDVVSVAGLLLGRKREWVSARHTRLVPLFGVGWGGGL